MNKKEILELYIQDLESKVPESDARNNRIEMLRNELKQVKNNALLPVVKSRFLKQIKMKLEIGKIYEIRHSERQVTRRHQSGFVVESRLIDVSGNYEYRGKQGHKFHFYDQDAGHDIYLDKDICEGSILNGL